MASMSRSRVVGNRPNEVMVDYYRQRATTGLIITEGVAPAADDLGYTNMPGFFNQEHRAGWQRVTEAVHQRGGHIFTQLMHTGRTFHPLNLPEWAEGVAIAASGDIWTSQQHDAAQ